VQQIFVLFATSYNNVGTVTQLSERNRHYEFRHFVEFLHGDALVSGFVYLIAGVIILTKCLTGMTYLFGTMLLQILLFARQFLCLSLCIYMCQNS